MPKGSPYSLRCPKCRRGQWGHAPVIKGCHATGETEKRLTRSNHKGYGEGGNCFVGWRGQVECRDCGHKWYSTHPRSGRLHKCWCTLGRNGKPKRNCTRCNGTGKAPKQA